MICFCVQQQSGTNHWSKAKASSSPLQLQQHHMGGLLLCPLSVIDENVIMVMKIIA
jgi:hypothetical protein